MGEQSKRTQGLTRRKVLKTVTAAGFGAAASRWLAEVVPAGPAEFVASAAGPGSTVLFPSFMWGEGWNAKYLNALKDAFESSNPGVRVNAVNVPISEYWDKLYVDTTAGAPPDIALLYDPHIRRYITADLLEPLDPWLKTAGYDLKDFWPIESLAVSQGHIYGIPMQINPRALFYNARLLNEARVAPPRDLNSFYAALRTLRDPSKQQFGYATFSTPGDPDLMYIEIMPLITGFGGGFFTKGKPSVTSPQTVAALEFYKRIYDEDLIPRGVDTATYRNMFIQGKVAMYASGPFMGGAVANANPDGYKDLAAMPLPFPGHRTMSVDSFFAIPKRAANKEGAARFLMMMLQDHWQQQVLEIIKALPARRSITDPNLVRNSPWFTAFQQAAVTARSYAPEGAEQYAPEVVKIISKHVEDMLFRGVAAKQMAQDLQVELERFMASKG